MRHSVGNNKHVWDGNNITAEKYYSSVTVYVYGIALIKSGTRYYLYSWHGDVIALINLAGSITKTYEYDAFGVEDDIDDSDSNPWRYCGEYYDKETKELYLRARYYDSVTGTFTQEDPIKDGNNWYSYCMGNPVVFTDPSGLFSWSNFGKIVAAVVVVAVVTTVCVATAGAALSAIGVASTVVSAATAAGTAGGLAAGVSSIGKKIVTKKINGMTFGEFIGDTAIDSAFGVARGMSSTIGNPAAKFAAGLGISYAEGACSSMVSGSTFKEAHEQGKNGVKSYIVEEMLGTAFNHALLGEISDEGKELIEEILPSEARTAIGEATIAAAETLQEVSEEKSDSKNDELVQNQSAQETPKKPKEPSKYIKNKMNKIFEDRGLDRPW